MSEKITTTAMNEDEIIDIEKIVYIDDSDDEDVVQQTVKSNVEIIRINLFDDDDDIQLSSPAPSIYKSSFKEAPSSSTISTAVQQKISEKPIPSTFKSLINVTPTSSIPTTVSEKRSSSSQNTFINRSPSSTSSSIQTSSTRESNTLLRKAVFSTPDRKMSIPRSAILSKANTTKSPSAAIS
jgi:hypothetical protein